MQAVVNSWASYEVIRGLGLCFAVTRGAAGGLSPFVKVCLTLLTLSSHLQHKDGLRFSNPPPGFFGTWREMFCRCELHFYREVDMMLTPELSASRAFQTLRSSSAGEVLRGLMPVRKPFLRF